MTLTRLNRIGLEYTLSGNEHKTTIMCESNGKSIIVNHSIDVLNQSWYDWQNGTMIQDAFNYLTNDEREFIMSGMDKEAWDEMVSEEER